MTDKSEIRFRAPPGLRASIKQAAQQKYAAGNSDSSNMSAWIRDAIREKLERQSLAPIEDEQEGETQSCS